MKNTNRIVLTMTLGLVIGAASSTNAATIYEPGVSPADGVSSLTFGAHLVSPDAHPSVAGTGGASGLVKAAGTAHNGVRTYIYDRGALPDLIDGTSNRADPGFAMMIWDMGAQFDSLRLYTHQDHYGGGPINDSFTAQDVMEYSVWGSQDGDDFVLLSDVTGFDISGGGPGLPTYTFNGTAPSVVYRGGSTEFGITNAYTREYVFNDAYRYFGIRTSTISLDASDADPEIDAVAAFNIADRPPGTPGTPEPTTLMLLGLAGFSALARRPGSRHPQA